MVVGDSVIVPQSSADFEKLLHKKKVKMATHLLSCGSCLGNLAISGRRSGAFRPGCYYLMPGDSDSGKTVVALTTLAVASRDPFFDDYNLVFDNAENGALMDIRHHFGKQAFKRIRSPKFREPGKIGSETVEEFYDCLSDEFEQPCIYVLDSENALTPESEFRRAAKNKAVRQKGKGELEQSYGVEKARLHSQGLRTIMRPLQRSGSILIIISQSRVDLNARFGEKKTRSGGKALKFFCTGEIWTSQIGEIKKNITAKRSEQIGIKVKVKVKRSRETGQHRAVDFPIYWEYGIDDIGSCIDFLINWGYWKKKAGTLTAPEFEHEGSARKLIRFIEENGMEEALHAIVAKCWKHINEQLSLGRKKRFS